MGGSDQPFSMWLLGISVHGASLQQNLGNEWEPMSGLAWPVSSPNQYFIDAAKYSPKKADRDWKRKVTEKTKEQWRWSKYSWTDDTAVARKSYSRHDNALEPDEVTHDVPLEYLTEMKQSVYDTKVAVTQGEAMDIER